MILFRKHIAVLLFGTFFFPIVFQPVHIVWHHSNGHEHEYRKSHNESSKNEIVTFKYSINQEVNSCPICEYQFYSNDRPEECILRTYISELNSVFRTKVAQAYQKQDLSEKSERAPPTSIS